MSEINLKSVNLSNHIADLKSLKNRISSDNNKCDAVRGGGTAIQELETLAGSYKKMKTNVTELIENTIGFMENINLSFTENDKKASNNFK